MYAVCIARARWRRVTPLTIDIRQSVSRDGNMLCMTTGMYHMKVKHSLQQSVSVAVDSRGMLQIGNAPFVLLMKAMAKCCIRLQIDP